MVRAADQQIDREIGAPRVIDLAAGSSWKQRRGWRRPRPAELAGDGTEEALGLT